MLEIDVITWNDSVMVSDQTDEIAGYCAVESAGFIVHEDDDEVVLAQDILRSLPQTQYRSQIAIPKSAIVDRMKEDDDTDQPTHHA